MQNVTAEQVKKVVALLRLTASWIETHDFEPEDLDHDQFEVLRVSLADALANVLNAVEVGERRRLEQLADTDPDDRGCDEALLSRVGV